MALLVLLAGIAAAAKLFPAGLSAGRRAAECTSAAVVAHDAMDYIKALGYDEANGVFRFGDTDLRADGFYYSWRASFRVHDWDVIVRWTSDLDEDNDDEASKFFKNQGMGDDEWVDDDEWRRDEKGLEDKERVGIACYGTFEDAGAQITVELVDGGMHMPVLYQHKVTVSVPVDREITPIQGYIDDPESSGPQNKWAVVDDQLAGRFATPSEGRRELKGKMLVMVSGEARGMCFLISDYTGGGKVVLRHELIDARVRVREGDKYKISDRHDFVTYLGRL